MVKYDESLALPYFMACVHETLRRDAPAQTILPRIISGRGLKLPDGEFIPPGTEMGASPYIIHRNESVFGKYPEEFEPDRWLNNPEQTERMERYSMAWGYGDRVCAGKSYAQMEMQKLCLELFRRFEIRSKGRERYIHKKWAVGMFWMQGLVFKRRTRSGKENTNNCA